MYHDFFAKSPLLAFPLVALVIFVVVFAVVVYRVLGQRGRDLEATAGRLPLVDDEQPILARATARTHSEVQEASHE